MIEEKKGGLSVFIAPTKTVGDVVISMCFELDADGCTLSKLNGCGSECSSHCFPSGSEEACLAYSLYSTVKQVLAGNALAVSKTKVGDVKCGVHDGMFFINWKVKGTVSAARKSLGMALKCMTPAKMWPVYSRCVKMLKSSPKKETFAYVADAAAKSIKNNLHVAIIGNIKADKAKLKDLVETVSKRLNAESSPGNKTKPADHTACDHTHLTELKISGYSSLLVSDYLQNKIKGLNPMVFNKKLILMMKPAQWETMTKKLKSGVKDFVATKYMKVADLGEVLGYYGLSSGVLCANDAHSMLNGQLSASTLESAINKYL
jgi:hypothetical protein